MRVRIVGVLNRFSDQIGDVVKAGDGVVGIEGAMVAEVGKPKREIR